MNILRAAQAQLYFTYGDEARDIIDYISDAIEKEEASKDATTASPTDGHSSQADGLSQEDGHCGEATLP